MPTTMLLAPPRLGVRWIGRTLAVAALLFLPSLLPAQTDARIGVRHEVFVGSEIESYLRFLQIEGKSALYPWSIRGFSTREVEHILPRDTQHPWAQRYALASDATGGLQLALIRPHAQLLFNSAFPYGGNDGPIWAGRGVTTALQAGFAARYGPLSLVVAPIAFRAQNAAFDLVGNGLGGQGAYADWRIPSQIDLPQRFGDQAYTRVDPGQSTLRLDLAPVTLGVSTANQHWGPAGEHPIVLGNNAPGFPHLFAGSARPLNLWIGRLHGRMVWGRLEQSSYTVASAPARRFMAGMVGVFTPRGVPGLELGGARFFHIAWTEEGISADDFLKPLEGLLKGSLPDRGEDPVDPKTDPDNQLASVFFRWVLPNSGFEVYGEYGREDHSWNLRDLILEPDHAGGYMLGFRSLWNRSDRSFVTLRAELLNLQISHLERVRPQSPFYSHTWIPQGHTQRGQLLGSAAGYGGAGSLVAADYYHPGGRWTLSWARELRQERGRPLAGPPGETRAYDVIHTLGAEGLLFLGRFEVAAGLKGGYNLNRNLGSDAFNLNAVLGVRAAF